MDTRRTTRSTGLPGPAATPRRLLALLATGALAAGLVGAAVLGGSGPQGTAAGRALVVPAEAAVGTDRTRNVNAREHLAHVGMQHVQDERRSRGACSDRLVQAWTELGHVSDAYGTYLLAQPPCA